MSTNEDCLQKAGNEFLIHFEELSRDALQAKPTPDCWSRQQVVEHMLLAYSGTVRELERRLAKGSPTHRKRTLKDLWGQFVIIGCGYFPFGRKAPQMVRPELSDLPPLEGTALAAEYRRRLADLERALADAESAWGPTATIATHTILGPLSAPQWRKFHAVHTRHHAKQMDRILAALQDS